MHPRPMQETNLLATIGLMGIGIAICAAWLWTANPDLVHSMWNSLGGGHWVVLAVLIVAGLIGVAFLRQMLFFVLQLMGAAVRLAVLVAAVAGGLYLWRGGRPAAVAQPSPRATSESSPEVVPQREISPDEAAVGAGSRAAPA